MALCSTNLTLLGLFQKPNQLKQLYKKAKVKQMSNVELDPDENAQKTHFPKTKFIQRFVPGYSLDIIGKEFSNITKIGKRSEIVEIPLVLVLPSRHNDCCCFQNCLPKIITVPDEGHYILWQKWYVDMGVLEPNPDQKTIILPPGSRVTHIITKAMTNYNVTITQIPTLDNVMIRVSVSLSFSIGPDSQSVRRFVYTLGAFRFTDFLEAELEESIRSLVYEFDHYEVSDLKDEFAQTILQKLNKKFSELYGVHFHKIQILQIVLPSILQERLEKNTLLTNKMKDLQNVFQSRVRVLEDEATKELEGIRNANTRKINELMEQRKRYEIERRELKERAETEQKIQLLQAKTEAEVALKKSIGDENLALLKSRQNAEALLKKTQMECQKMKLEAEQKANVMIKNSEAALRVAEQKANVMITKAEVEDMGQEQLQEKRHYELEWARLEVLKKIAKSGRKFISGEKGEKILNDLIPDHRTSSRTRIMDAKPSAVAAARAATVTPNVTRKQFRSSEQYQESESENNQ